MPEEALSKGMESPPRFSFPELLHEPCLYSEMSSCTSTPFVSAPSSPSRMKGFYFSAPTSPTWANRALDMVDNNPWDNPTWHPATGHGFLESDKTEHGLMEADKSVYELMEADKTEQKQGFMENRTKGFMDHRVIKTGQQGLMVRRTAKTEQGSMESLADKAEPRLTLRPLRIDTSHHTPVIENVNGIGDGDGDSYSRKSFYASAIPFSWEEKPGTPKARERSNNNGYGDFADEEEQENNREHSSILHSGSSEFEFSSRFSEIEDPPMSPTPILSSSSSFFNRQPDPQPLRPPPRLQTPVKELIKEDFSSPRLSPKASCISLSAPQSPRSPFKHGIRGVFCGLSNPSDGVFDPFLVAMEKMASNDVKKDVESKNGHHKDMESKNGHHRRAHSYTPMSMFKTDELSARPESANSSMDVDQQNHIKFTQPHQSRSKGSKRWSFKGILHRKSNQSSNPSSLRSNSSCSSSMGETGDVSMDDNTNKHNPNPNHNVNPKLSSASLLSSASSSSSSSSSSSGNSTNGRRRLNQQHRSSNNKGLYALHYNMQRAQTEELRKKTFLPYKQSLLGCLGISSKSYRAIAALSKPMQPVS